MPPPRRRPLPPPEPQPKVTAKFELTDGTKVTLSGDDGAVIGDAAWDIIQNDRKRHADGEA